ncbi:sperm-associated antigen 5 isoform 1-T4 [Mantella aurantiaca]
MSSPASPASNENQVPEAIVHRKSVGRTPLKALGVLDPNSLNNHRLSLPKPSSKTNLPYKATSPVSSSIPASIWVDTCREDGSMASSATQSSSSLENKELQVLQLSANMKVDYQCESVLVSDFACSDLPQKSVLENPAIECLKEECNTMASLASEAADESSPSDGQQAVSTDLSVQIALDSCNNTVSSTLLTTSADLYAKSSINKVNLSASDYAHCAVLTTNTEDHLKVTDSRGFMPELNNVFSADRTYELIPKFDGESEICILPMLSGEISDLTQKVENLGIFVNEDEASFPTVPDTGYDCIRNDLAKNLSTSLLGDAIKEDKSEHIVNGSSAFWDSAVALDSIVSHVILGDDSSPPLVTSHAAKTLTGTDEYSLYSTENCTEIDLDMRESADKCFSPIGGSTPHSKRKECDSIKVTNTERLTSGSHLHETGHSIVASDPQRNKEVAASAKCSDNCPTPVIPSQSHEILSLGRRVCNKIFPKPLASFNEVGSSMTPISTSEEITWTTPVMLLNKSMNTSWNLKGNGVKSSKDNASETDPLLWNFSKEAFCDASREELKHRLEGTLIVVEVLSRQLQGWQQTVISKPSEQREASTQTCVTYDSEEERYYHNLYFKALSRQQAMQRCHEDEKQLLEVLKEAAESLTSYKSEAASMVKFAENLYKTVQKDRADLNHTVSCTHSILADYITSLSKMSKNIKNNQLEKEEMKTRMEEAQLGKQAADQCLEDLEIHSSAVIAQLRRDLETERKICETVREAYEQQSSYNEELAGFVQRAHSVCSEVKDDRTQLLIQCSQARELLSRHWHLFTIMKEKSQVAIEKYDRIKNERDNAILENKEMSSCLEDLKSFNEQIKLENARLGSELESLMERLCGLESEIDQWKDDNSELAEQLSARDSSVKLLEKELNEATARGQAYQDRIKHFTAEIVPSLELKLSELSSQKRSLQIRLQDVEKEHASQITYYTESLEFLEQENHVFREQVAETESQGKVDHLNLLDRNYQCENQKDTIKKLEKDVSELKQTLIDAEYEAQSVKAKTAKEMSILSSEVSNIKARLLDVIRNLKESSQKEIKGNAYGLHTPCGSLTFSNTFTEESIQTTTLNVTDFEDPKAEGIWSETSAFTVVKPVSLSTEGNAVVILVDLLHELSSVVSDVATVSSRAIDTKQDLIRNLKMDISSLKEELQNQRYQHKSEVRDLQEEVDRLKKSNGVLDEKLTTKEKYIRSSQELASQREQKIIQQITKINEIEDVIQENAKLKFSLKQCNSEVEVLKKMLTQNRSDTERNWIEEKLMMHKDLIALNIKLDDVEHSKSEAIQKLMRHRKILEENLARSEAEVQKLDDIIDKIRQALLSVPDVVNQCHTLRQLKEFLN